MYGILLINERIPNYAALTYEEHNERHPVRVNPQLAPELARDTYTGPGVRKPAQMQAAIFYQPNSQDGRARPYNVGLHNLGWHTVVAQDGGSWTASPRGILRSFGKRRPVARRDPASYGVEVPEVMGG